VVVGHDQAVRRHERSGAAAQGYDRTHGLPGQIGEGFRIALEAHGFQLGREFGDLLGHPHASVGVEPGGAEGRGE
jgi:hypothetical protein